jgi:hypothetical protein
MTGVKASDWITLLGAVVVAIAVVVSAWIALVAVTVQRNQAEIQRSQAETERQQAQEDTKRELAEVSQTLASKIAQLSILPVTSPEAIAASSEVMGLVIRANELASASSKAAWYLYYSLAMAYGWLWEIAPATENWKKALDNADTVHSQIIVLTGAAAFYYATGSIQEGRGCFIRAEEILKKDYLGDLGRDQLAQVLVWQEAIGTPWRQRRASSTVGDAFAQTFGQDQTRPSDTIPSDLVAFARALWQQQTHQPFAFEQQAANAQQSFAQRPLILQDGGSFALNQQSAGPPESDPTQLPHDRPLNL